MGTGRRGRGGERGHKQYTVANVALALKWHYEWVMRETSNATMEAVNKDAAAHGVHVPVCVCVCETIHTHTYMYACATPQQSLDWLSSICKSMQPEVKKNGRHIVFSNRMTEKHKGRKRGSRRRN